MVQVRQLIGPYAGQVQEMPYDVAQNCHAAGTVAWLDEIPPRVHGTVFEDDPVAAAAPAATVVDPGDIVIPPDWEALHHMQRKALARRIAGTDWDGDANAADAVIRGHLELYPLEVDDTDTDDDTDDDTDSGGNPGAEPEGSLGA